MADAEREFTKYFRSKTGVSWDERASATTAKDKKYAVVEMESDAAAAATQAQASAVTSAAAASQTPIAACALPAATKGLVELIFDQDMFRSAMSEFEIDAARLPLGALSAAQLNTGYAALVEVRDAVARSAPRDELARLSNAFYSAIPHAFGRSVPPPLASAEAVSKKFDMLNVLSDITAAQAMADAASGGGAGGGQRLHPTDLNYQQLHATLTPLDASASEHAMVQTYFEDGRPQGVYGFRQLAGVFRVDRHGEAARFAAHRALGNRRLLWHGTSVAVVAAILKSGLRIMPHSGGRVGRGIYLADQHQKSAAYVTPARGKAIMFLVEAALGTEHHIRHDDPSLVRAPPPCDSVVALGRSGPDHDDVTYVSIDGAQVEVPLGKPKPTHVNSSFHHNEFLVYNESQHRIRYVCVFDM